MNLNLIVENLDLVANFIAGWLPFLLGYLALGVLGGPVLQLDVYFLERELARAERMLGVASTLPRNYTLARQGDIDRITEVRALLRASTRRSARPGATSPSTRACSRARCLCRCSS